MLCKNNIPTTIVYIFPCQIIRAAGAKLIAPEIFENTIFTSASTFLKYY